MIRESQIEISSNQNKKISRDNDRKISTDKN